MDLGLMDRPIAKPHSRYSLSLPPTTPTVPTLQPPQLSDRSPDRDCFYGADRANDLEVHLANLACRLQAPEIYGVAELLLSRPV